MPVGLETCAYAARGGHFEVLKWARENGCEWNYQTCTFAAEGGHLEVLKWARERPWNENTCENAAFGGHLETLKCARERLPWTSGRARAARRRPPR